MLEHLDDPHPPRPSGLVVERIAAEGARRLRHRRIAAGGVLMVASTLVVVGLAVALRPSSTGDKVDTVGPSGSTSTAPPGTGGATPPAAGLDGDIVAVIRDPGADRARVVRLDPSTGSTESLATYELRSRPPLCCIELDAAGVHYVVPAGQGDSAEDTIWHVDLGGGQPAPVASGTNPAASPDGSRLALTRTTADGPTVVVRHLATGTEQVIPAAADDTLRDVDWYDDDTLVVISHRTDAASVAYRLELGSARSLADATRLGPAEDAPPGTGWDWVDRRPDGWLTLAQTCCTLDAGSTDGDASYFLVDSTTGTVTEGSDLPGPVSGIATGPLGDRELLLVPPPDGQAYAQLQILMDTDLTPVPGEHEVLAADW
jgi:hypothetical protein